MKSVWIKFNNKDFKQNTNLVSEMLEYEWKFKDIKDNYGKTNTITN